MKEKSLSEKIGDLTCGHCGEGFAVGYFKDKDVQEAVRRLKEKINHTGQHWNVAIEIAAGNNSRFEYQKVGDQGFFQDLISELDEIFGDL